MDLDYIRTHDLDTITPIIVTNTDQYHQVDLVVENIVQHGEDFIVIK